jgi:hypothetical protein
MPPLRGLPALGCEAGVPRFHHRKDTDQQPGARDESAYDRAAIQRRLGGPAAGMAAQMDRDLFYDESRIAIVPMGLCYPGRLPNGGDAPPRPECAPLWLDRFTRLMPQVRLTLLVGSYALRHRLGKGAMTEQVRRFRELGPAIIPRHIRPGAPRDGSAAIRGSAMS